jgi:hypothetical protein
MFLEDEFMKAFIFWGLTFFLAACNISPAPAEPLVRTDLPSKPVDGTALPETGREEEQAIQSPPTTPVGVKLEENTSLMSGPLAQEDIDSCPVTLLNNKSPAEQSASDFNLGNDAGTLFTIPWPGGVVLFTPNGAGQKSSDGSLSMKWPWYRTVPGDVIIGGQRLDADAPRMPTITLRGEEDGYGETGFHPSGLTWPGEGCWEVIARVGEEKLTFVTLVIKVPFDPLWPTWLPDGLTVQDKQIGNSPWSVQDIYRSTDGSREVVVETNQSLIGNTNPSREEPFPKGAALQIAVNGRAGVCVQGYRDEGGRWQPDTDAAVLEWKGEDLHYSVRQTGLGLSCEDLVKIAGS